MNKKLMEQIMRDDTPLIIETHIAGAWLMLTWIQLAYRHPRVTSGPKDRVRQLMKPYEDSILQLHPEAKSILEFGWRK